MNTDYRKLAYSIETISPIKTLSLELVHLFGVSLIISLNEHLTATKEFVSKIDSAKYCDARKWLHETEINKIVSQAMIISANKYERKFTNH